LSLAEVVPRRAQRLSGLLDLSALDDELVARLHVAEENIYCDANDPLLNWDLTELEAALLDSGLQLRRKLAPELWEEERQITAMHLARWFAKEKTGTKLSYASRLLPHLTAEEVQQVKTCFRRQLIDQIVPWQTTLVYLNAVAAAR
jgi:hypothetical protein